MKEQIYLVIKKHVSEYPDPITLQKGDTISIGEIYTGPENWDNWYLCSAKGQNEGWVPGQIIEHFNDKTGIVKENYTARELDVTEGERLIGSHILNGWMWCTRPSDRATGWVPLKNLTGIGSQ